MTDFDKVFWGFIFSAAGIAFGWILNQLGQWSRIRQEDKRSLKIVLFNLLETYFIFSRSDLDKYVEKITNAVHSKLPIEEQTDDSKITIQRIYTAMVVNHLKPELVNEIKAVQESYQNSIITLAAIDPLTAYYLSRRTNIIEGLDSLATFFENIKEHIPEEQGAAQIQLNHFLRVIKPDIFSDALNDVEVDIREVAWKINPYVWYKSIGAIKKLKLRSDANFEEEFDKLINKVNPNSGNK